MAGIRRQMLAPTFDGFVHEFNFERPHEALNMKCPAEVYTPASREYNGLPELQPLP